EVAEDARVVVVVGVLPERVVLEVRPDVARRLVEGARQVDGRSGDEPDVVVEGEVATAQLQVVVLLVERHAVLRRRGRSLAPGLDGGRAHQRLLSPRARAGPSMAGP